MDGWIDGWTFTFLKKAFISDFVSQENKMLDPDWLLETRAPHYSPC